jgi:hypothetical protein
MVPEAEDLFQRHWTTSKPEWRSMFKDEVPFIRNPAPLRARELDIELELYERTVTPSPQKVNYKEALDYCTQQISGGECNTVVDPLPFIDSCVDDAIVLGSFSMSIDHQHAFLEQCLGITNLLMRSGIETQINIGLKIQIANGLNDNPCPSSCVGHVCARLGCVCSEDRVGTFCEFAKLNQ